MLAEATVSDIFISYSKQDAEEARLLAAFLEAEGYSVWWDTSLLSGDNFRKVIMTELGQSRAAIVIWTENSIQSDWVQSEAGRAHADRKLIPVKARGLSYRDIPPPFDNMHIENVDDREKILAAVVAQLAKPVAQPSTMVRAARHARFQLLSWFGIAGAAISLATNLQGLLTLARWARSFFELWTVIVQYVWTHVLFFLPKVYGSDALVLTLMLFAAVNMIMCSIRTANAPTRRRALTILSILIGSVVIIVMFGFGMHRIGAGETAPDQGYWGSFSQELWDFALGHLGIVKRSALWWFFWGLFVCFWAVLVPLLPALALYLVLRRFASFRFSAAALSSRLWKIIAGVGLVIGLNYLSLWIEQQPWAAQLIK